MYILHLIKNILIILGGLNLTLEGVALSPPPPSPISHLLRRAKIIIAHRTVQINSADWC